MVRRSNEETRELQTFDVVKKRQPHYAASNKVLCLCRRHGLAGMVAYHTIANVV